MRHCRPLSSPSKAARGVLTGLGSAVRLWAWCSFKTRQPRDHVTGLYFDLAHLQGVRLFRQLVPPGKCWTAAERAGLSGCGLKCATCLAIYCLCMQAARGGLALSSAASEPEEQASTGSSPFNFTGDWFSHNIVTWQRVLASKNWLDNSSQAVHVLEVGSWEGRSAVWFLSHVCLNKASTLTAIDCWLGAQFYGARAKACTASSCRSARLQAPAPCHALNSYTAWPSSQSFGLDEHTHSSGRVEGRFDRNVAVTGAQHKVVKLKGHSLQGLARLVADAAKVYDVRWRALPTRLLLKALVAGKGAEAAWRSSGRVY